jgi:hypothetical protein
MLPHVDTAIVGLSFATENALIISLQHCTAVGMGDTRRWLNSLLKEGPLRLLPSKKIPYKIGTVFCILSGCKEWQLIRAYMMMQPYYMTRVFVLANALATCT